MPSKCLMSINYTDFPGILDISVANKFYILYYVYCVWNNINILQYIFINRYISLERIIKKKFKTWKVYIRVISEKFENKLKKLLSENRNVNISVNIRQI